MPCIHLRFPGRRRLGRLALLTLALLAGLLGVLPGPLSLGESTALAAKPGRRGKPTAWRRGGARRSTSRALPPLRDGKGLATALPPARPKAAVAQLSPVAQRPAPIAPQGLTFAQTPSPQQVAPPLRASPRQVAPPLKRGQRKPPKAAPTDSELLDEAHGAYVNGERQRSIDMAMVVAEKNGELAPRAWQFIGLAACSVKAHRLATRAYQSLKSSSEQRTVAEACRHNGLTFRDEQFFAP